MYYIASKCKKIWIELTDICMNKGAFGAIVTEDHRDMFNGR